MRAPLFATVNDEAGPPEAFQSQLGTTESRPNLKEEFRPVEETVAGLGPKWLRTENAFSETYI